MEQPWCFFHFPFLPPHSVPQMLVYENYNKFITATDTIKLMSASMEGMDDRMTQLKALIGT